MSVARGLGNCIRMGKERKEVRKISQKIIKMI